ncbi:MAG: DUF1156 domain-containing protein, partial [Planctomycetes bacterium]|nr:DUF1156 domain-containing protein [Planctomycetota bacterium]
METFHELVEECGGAGDLKALDLASLIYLSIAIDKVVSYNSILCRWDVTRPAIRGKFDRHDYAFLWSYGEIAPAITGKGYEWAIKQTGKALSELMGLFGCEAPKRKENSKVGPVQTTIDLPEKEKPETALIPPVITCQSADVLMNVEDASVDAVVMDPPYYDNVMYAELADFFYVWLKRTAGLLYPGQFA